MKNKITNIEKKGIKKASQNIKNTNMNLDRKKIFIIAITITVILAVAAIIIAVILNNNKVNNENNINNPNGENIPKQEEQNNSTDLSNTENVNITQDGTKENNSSKLMEEKNFEGMIIKNIKLIAKDGLTNFTATIDNTNGGEKAARPVTIVFTNKEGKEISFLDAYIGDIKAGGISMIDAGSTADLSNAYNFTIKSK